MSEFIEKMRIWATKLSIKQDNLFAYDVHKQIQFVGKFKKTENDMERSFFQYKCQVKMMGKLLFVILNIASLPVGLFYYMKMRKKRLENKVKEQKDVFISNGLRQNLIPKSLASDCNNLQIVNGVSDLFLDQDAKALMRELAKSHPFSWFFLLKCLLKIGLYCDLVYKYSPQKMIVSAEYSFTSSVLTFYCEKKDIQHINIMHGETMLYMTASFFKFTKCFIWDEHYRHIFLTLKAYPKQFIIEEPPALYFKKERTIHTEIDYTYYLGRETEKELRKLKQFLALLVEQGKIIALRPHPLVGDLALTKEIFSGFVIEAPEQISIQKSINRTKNVVALFSTVLYQAYKSDIPVVIDDITNRSKYEKLKSLDYIMLSKPHTLLSDLIN